MANVKRIIIYAPNIHLGGGLILLRALFQSLSNVNNIIIFVDERGYKELGANNFPQTYLVKPTFIDRLYNEIILSKISRPGDVVLCFHGLPPLFKNLGKIIVYQQNALLVNFNLLFGYKSITAIRIYCERLISYIFKFRVSEYIVQTQNMANILRKWYGSSPSKRELPLKISVMPFAVHYTYKPETKKTWDFIYVADGLNHKNHDRLLDAWSLLAKEGIKPTLLLTIPFECINLINKINLLKSQGVNIFNVGPQTHDKLHTIYSESKALIYPSLIESFGLPLFEASTLNLDIIASELDYVYEVCKPIFTFDPYSISSIARSIKRYLGLMDECNAIYTPAQFTKMLIENSL